MFFIYCGLPFHFLKNIFSYFWSLQNILIFTEVNFSTSSKNQKKMRGKIVITFLFPYQSFWKRKVKFVSFSNIWFYDYWLRYLPWHKVTNILLCYFLKILNIHSGFSQFIFNYCFIGGVVKFRVNYCHFCNESLLHYLGSSVLLVQAEVWCRNL